MKLFLRSLRMITNILYNITKSIEMPLIILFYIALYKKLLRSSLSRFVQNNENYAKKLKSLTFIFDKIDFKYFKKYKKKRKKILLMLIIYFLFFVVPFDKLSIFTLKVRYALIQVSIFFIYLQFFSITVNNLLRNIKYLIKNKIKTNFKITTNEINSNMYIIFYHFLICIIIYSYTFIYLIFKKIPSAMKYFLVKIPLRLLQLFKKNNKLTNLLFIKKHL